MRFLISMGAGPERDSFFTPYVLKELSKHADLIFNEFNERGLSKEHLINMIPDVDVLFSGWGTARVDSDVLKAANKLKIHAHTGGSVASYISREEYEKGIFVLSGNDLYAHSVAEGCLCYTLCAQRRIVEYNNTIHQGGWRPAPDHTLGLIGKKIGLVGFGAIAAYYAELLRWFQPELLIASKYAGDEEVLRLGARKATMEEIFSTCDVISLHAALNEENKNMITRDLLSLIKPNALFVNTARAGLMEEQILCEALKTKRFRAVLDVYHQEPLAEDNVLRTLDNVMLMPHIAGPTFDMREKVVLRLLEDILAIGEKKEYKSGISYDYAIRMTI